MATDPTTVADDEATVPCPACNGDGESDESPLVPCHICLGTGKENPHDQ